MHRVFGSTTSFGQSEISRTRTNDLINNRQQAGRRRGRGGGNGGGGQRGPQNNGSRIDNRARGNASQLYEKYKNMAADAQRAGDRVNTEYYYQFADHYFRVLSEQRGRFEEQQPRRGRDDFDDDGDAEFAGGEYGDEGEPARANGGGDQPMSQPMGQRFDREDRGQQRGDDRPREAREDRPRGDGRDGYRRDGNGDGRGRGEWQDRPRRDRRPEQGDRSPEQVQQPVAERPVIEVAGQRRAEPMLPGESLEHRAEEVLEADRPLDAPAPRRRGRPRRDAQPGAGEPAANGAGEADGFEADRLPPALNVAANDETPADAKPRRRRARQAEDTPSAAE